MSDPAHIKELLAFAVSYIEQHNRERVQKHTNTRTREIEPASLRAAVAATNKWLERARRAIAAAPGEPMDQLLKVPHVGPTGEHPNGRINAEDEGALTTAVGIDAGRVVVRYGVPVAWVGFDAQGAADFAACLIKHARIAGKTTGRMVEVKL